MIRVLRLHPNTKRQPLVGKLLEREAGLGHYEALSYCWGTTEPPHFITIGDDRRLRITKSCADALSCLRDPAKERTLWVDSICIDQGNDAAAIEERNQQVAMMDQIYYSASQVLVWLGPGNNNSNLLFKHLWKIGSISKHRNIRTRIPEWQAIRPRYLFHVIRVSIEKNILRKFFDRRFIEALWQDDGK
jgi:hypothetical protein